MALQGALLDVDGTLVLSNDSHAQAWVDAFAAFGHQIDYDRVRSMIGMGGDRILPAFVPGLNDQTGDGKAIADRRKSLVLEQYAPTLSAANGARQLVLKMQASGLKLIIASSATPEELEVLLKRANVDDLLHAATTSSDAEQSKPAPDIVQAALSRSQMQPEQAVMLGDSPYDVESATSAGVPLIALRCGGFSDQQLSGAIAIYDDPADLLRHYDDSPLANATYTS